MAKKKKAHRGSAKRGHRKAAPTKFSMKAGHGAMNTLLTRLKKINTPRSQEIQKQIKAILADTKCPQGMVIEL